MVGGHRAAHMGEPEAEGRRRVATRHPAARPLLPGPQAAAGNRLRPATAHPRARYGGYATWRCVMLLAVIAVQSERASSYPPEGGEGTVQA